MFCLHQGKENLIIFCGGTKAR